MRTRSRLRLEGICFDMDGTLTNTIPAVLHSFRVTFEHFLARTYADDEIRALFGPTEEGIIQKVLPDRSAEGVRYYHRVYEEYHREYAAKFQGIEEALDLLKQDKQKRLGIVTGKGPVSVSITLEQLGLGRFFDVIECGSSIGAAKPEAIRKIARRWKVDPREIGYLGDAAYDMRAAKEAGAIPLGAAWDKGSEHDELEELAYAVFLDVESFVRWIRSSLI